MQLIPTPSRDWVTRQNFLTKKNSNRDNYDDIVSESHLQRLKTCRGTYFYPQFYIFVKILAFYLVTQSLSILIPEEQFLQSSHDSLIQYEEQEPTECQAFFPVVRIVQYTYCTVYNVQNCTYNTSTYQCYTVSVYMPRA